MGNGYGENVICSLFIFLIILKQSGFITIKIYSIHMESLFYWRSSEIYGLTKSICILKRKSTKDTF